MLRIVVCFPASIRVRVRRTEAKPEHTRQYLATQQMLHYRYPAAWSWPCHCPSDDCRERAPAQRRSSRLELALSLSSRLQLNLDLWTQSVTKYTNWLCLMSFLILLSQELCRELLSRDLIYLIDYVFWNLSFKNETQAEKVILNMHVIPILYIYTLYWLNLLLELDLSY